MSISYMTAIMLALSVTAILAAELVVSVSEAYIPGGVVGVPNMPDIVTQPANIPGGVPGIPNISEGPANNQGTLTNIFGP